ncbi:MAG: phage major capsid protein [Holosporales bacterium]
MTHPYETKALSTELGESYAAFCEANDERLMEAAEKGHSDPLLDEKVQRLNSSLEQLQEKMETLQVAYQRTPSSMASAKKSSRLEPVRKAFHDYLRKGTEPTLALKAHSVSSDPEGGYMVSAELSSSISQVLRDSSPLRQLATVIEVASDAFEILTDPNDVGTAWVAETGARNETATADVGKIRIPVHELYAEPRITQKLLDDARFDVEQWLATKIADRFARAENTAFISGNGVAQPRGILTYSGGTSFGQIERRKTGVNGDWPASNPADALVDLSQLLKTSYTQGAAFLLNRSLMADVRKFKGSDGQYIWQPSYNAGQPAQLLGYPVYVAEDMPNKATGSLSVAFGNFRLGYAIVDRIGTRILRDPFTAKPYVKFYTTKRVGGDVINSDAIKLMEFAA